MAGKRSETTEPSAVQLDPVARLAGYVEARSLEQARETLAQQHVVVAEHDAKRGVRPRRLVRSIRPELAIVDIGMPPSHANKGLEAATVIRQELPATAIIVLSVYVELDDAMELLAGGDHLGVAPPESTVRALREYRRLAHGPRRIARLGDVTHKAGRQRQRHRVAASLGGTCWPSPRCSYLQGRTSDFRYPEGPLVG